MSESGSQPTLPASREWARISLLLTCRCAARVAVCAAVAWCPRVRPCRAESRLRAHSLRCHRRLRRLRPAQHSRIVRVETRSSGRLQCGWRTVGGRLAAAQPRASAQQGQSTSLPTFRAWLLLLLVHVRRHHEPPPSPLITHSSSRAAALLRVGWTRPRIARLQAQWLLLISSTSAACRNSSLEARA